VGTSIGGVQKKKKKKKEKIVSSKRHIRTTKGNRNRKKTKIIAR